MSNYRIETLGYEDLKKVMAIPHYQRPLVWSSAQKASFIDNISKGFPFGSLLLYKYDIGEKYSLIDGQQRFTTLQDYQHHPERYFPIESEQSKYIDSLLDVTGISNLPADACEHLRHNLIGAVKDLFRLHASGQNPDNSFLADRIKDEYSSAFAGDNSFQILMKVVNIQGELIHALDSYVDLSSLAIPCVIYTGDKSQLPDVFANVNLGGRKLTKYQVFAAQWDRYKVKLSELPTSSSIMDKAINRYEALTQEREGLEIEDFSPEEMRASNQVTLPELCRALGEMIVELCPAFWPEKTTEKEDVVDTIGYNTLAIVFGIRPQEIAGKPGSSSGLPDRFSEAGFENDPLSVDRLLNRILDEYREINGRFAKHLRVPGTNGKFDTSKSSVVLQFLSFFAALWNIRYGAIASTQFESRSGYSKNGYDYSKKQLFKCFVLDMLNKKWKGSGDSRLGNYVDGTLNYYSTSAFSREALETATQVYLESVDGSESLNADPVGKTLITILANSHPSQYQETSYDVEHLISREALRTRHGGGYAYKTFKLPGGDLGNLAYLAAHENRSKGSKNVADTCGELQFFDGTREYIEDLGLLRDTDYSLRNGNPEPARKFLHERAQILLESLVHYLTK